MKSAESFTLAIVNLVIVSFVCAICLLHFPGKFIKKPITKWSILNRYEAVITFLSLISIFAQLIELSVHVRKLVVNNPEIAADWRSPSQIFNPVIRWVVSPSLAVDSVAVVLFVGLKYRSITLPNITHSAPHRQSFLINIGFAATTLTGIWAIVSAILTDILPEDAIFISRVCSVLCLSGLLMLFTGTIEFMIFLMIFNAFPGSDDRPGQHFSLRQFQAFCKKLLTGKMEEKVLRYMIMLFMLGSLSIALYVVSEFHDNKIWLNYYASMSNAVGLCALYKVPTLLSKFHAALKRTHRVAMKKHTSNVTELSTVQSWHSPQGHPSMMDPSAITTDSRIFDDDSEEEEQRTSKLTNFFAII